jgi:C-terminal processing protease CtpA/Prc|tara:strand:+ start:35 stop:370 length:336 start_codon:yes stop_codon:yes gene_type:complete
MERPSAFTIPSFGPYDADGAWAIEQRGVVPDVVVANAPVATSRGGDAQLDAAIEVLNKKLAEAPAKGKVPIKPTYPNRSFDAKTCEAGGDGSAKEEGGGGEDAKAAKAVGA